MTSRWKRKETCTQAFSRSSPTWSNGKSITRSTSWSSRPSRIRNESPIPTWSNSRLPRSTTSRQSISKKCKTIIITWSSGRTWTSLPGRLRRGRMCQKRGISTPVPLAIKWQSAMDHKFKRRSMATRPTSRSYFWTRSSNRRTVSAATPSSQTNRTFLAYRAIPRHRRTRSTRSGSRVRISKRWVTSVKKIRLSCRKLLRNIVSRAHKCWNNRFSKWDKCTKATKAWQ